MDNLFKTDGIRGLSQIELTPLLFHKLGIYLALNSNLPIGLGYDTRESSILYKNIISTTINSLGKDVYDFGIVTTPCLNYLSKELHCEYGVMITASHNPYQYNGIKIFDNNGKKIDIFLQEEISNFIKTFKSVKFYPKSIGKTFDKHKDVNNYINFIISKFNFIKILNKEIILDASNGSGSLIFKNIIEKLGFNNFISKNDCPNGQNINKDCGSTYLENDKNKEKRLILALDGDGDRFIGSYNSYKIDDEILCYLLINLYNDKFKNGIVSTPLTNRKIVQAITKEGIPYYESKVGDSNVFDLMIKKHCKFGFEASGHLLFSSYSDGILSSLIFLSLLEKDENKIKKLLKDLKLNHFKQLNYSLKNTDEFIFNITHSDIYKSLISYIKPGGRILFRKSGTEDLCRIILESRSKKAIKKVQKEIEKYIEDKRCVE